LFRYPPARKPLGVSQGSASLALRHVAAAMRAWGPGPGAPQPASPPGRKRSRSRVGRWSRGRELPSDRGGGRWAGNGRGGGDRQTYESFGTNGGKGRGKSKGHDGSSWSPAWKCTFGVEDKKKAERAKRFGLQSAAPQQPTQDGQHKAKRAKRLGAAAVAAATAAAATAVAAPASAEKAPPPALAEATAPDTEAAAREDRKKAERAARFGLTNGVAVAASLDVEPGAVPAAVPGGAAEVAQKLAERAKRFGLSTPQGIADKVVVATTATSTPAADGAVATADTTTAS